MIETKKTNNTTSYVLAVACFFTVISQLPVFVDMSLSSPISTIIWVVLFGYVIVTKKVSRLPRITPFFFIVFTVFLLYCLICYFFDERYFISSIPKQIFLSLFVLVVGFFSGQDLEVKDLNKIFNAYILATFIVTLSVFFEFLRGADITEYGYLYGSKNSISQIILSSTILILINKISNSRVIKKLLYVLLIVFNIYVLIFLKSRSVLVLIPLIIFIILFNKNVDKRIKRIVFAITIVAVGYLLINPQALDVLVQNVIYAGREQGDLDSISSGRASQWQNFWADFMEYPLFGLGGRHRESIILASFLEFGFFGGVLIMLLACYPLYWGMKYLPRKNKISITFILIAMSYLFNGIFEMLAPFGPGVKCFLLWYLLGILSTMPKKALYNESNGVSLKKIETVKESEIDGETN